MGSKLLTRTKTTTRQRGGVAFIERWTNATAAHIGFWTGRGYSSVAIAEQVCGLIGKTVSDATIRCMQEKWGLPRGGGRKSEHYIQVPVKTRDRATLYARAQQEGLSLEEYCRRFLVAGSVKRDTFSQVVSGDQFE